MRVYFNTSALSRPFDDLSSTRVRLEAEAVVALVQAVESGSLEWIAREYLAFEVGQDPDRERVHRLGRLMELVTRRVEVSDALLKRARELEHTGLRGLDALHVASAEAGGAELLVTTDDRMIRTARRASAGLRVRVVTPPEAVQMVSIGDRR
jgi:predicted nucleic acid-binding protein